MHKPDFYCVNESAGVEVPLQDRGFAFGDGVFETMRVEQGAIPLWEYHRERLLKGLAALSIAVPIARLEHNLQLQRQAFEQRSGCVQGISKLVVTRGCSVGGYQYPDSIEATIALTFTQKQIPVAGMEHLCRSQVAVYGDPRVSGIKHLSRLENVLARQEAQSAGYSDAVLSLESGALLETTNSNLFFETEQGDLVTPSMGHAGVNGVMKRLIRESIGPALGISVIEREVYWHEIGDFVSAFKTNAVSGVTPVASIAYRRYQFSNLIQELQERVLERFEAPRFGKQQGYFDIE